MSIRRSAALILVPVLVLAGIAGFGLASYRYAVVAEARDSAAVWVRRADDFQARFAARAAELPPVVGYAAIPAGGDPPSGDARRLEAAGSDPAALRALVGSREPSASGLPVAVLAAWRLYAATGDPADAEALARLAIHELPSPISEPALRSLAEKMPAPGEAWLAEWRLAEARRAVIAALPGGGPGFVRTGAGAGFGSGDRALAPAEVRALAAEIRGEEVRAGLPPWMALGFEAAGESLTAPVADPLAGAEAEAAPDGGSGLRVVAGIADESVLFARYRRVVWWAVALIGCSLAASAAGIAAMARAVANERRLGAQKSQFVASVSHELRTPVASMRLMAEALDAGRVGGAEAREFHRLMAQEGARLSALIENVLEFARIEGGRKTYRFAETDLAALAADTAALMEPVARERGIRIAVDARPALADADAAAIQQAAVNLLDNAIKFSPPGSTVRLAVAPAEAGAGGWVLGVADEGPGIPRALRDRAFERFVRLGDELRRETKGAGIGLSLVKHIAEGHGGTACIADAPGGGALVSIRCPGRGERLAPPVADAPLDAESQPCAS